MNPGLPVFFIYCGPLSSLQAPANMKSVLQGGWLLTVAFGNVIVLIVAEGAGLEQVSCNGILWDTFKTLTKFKEGAYSKTTVTHLGAVDATNNVPITSVVFSFFERQWTEPLWRHKLVCGLLFLKPGVSLGGYALLCCGSESPGNHAQKHTPLYCLFYSKYDHILHNEHHALLKKTWN